MPNIIFYHQHHGGLGSQVRILSIAKATKKLMPDSNVIIIAGNDYAPVMLNSIEGIEIFFLPRIILTSQNGLLFQSKFIKNLKDTKPNVFTLRKRIIDDILSAYSPDVFIIDQFPFGRRSFENEIYDILHTVHDHNKNCVIVSSVKDIFGRVSMKSGLKADLPDSLESDLSKHIQCVLYHSDPRIITHAEILVSSGMKSLQVPVVYTGYVKSTIELYGLIFEEDRWDIVASMGSGIDALRGISILVEALRLFENLDARILMITGSLCPPLPSPMRKMSHKITIVPSVKNLYEVLIRAKVTILMGGSSLIDAAAAGTPAIYLPRIDVEDNDEQLFRAKRFAASGFGKLIRTDDKNAPQLLTTEIKNLLNNENTMRFGRIECRGAIKAAKVISLLSKGQRDLPLSYIDRPYKAMVEVMRSCNLKCPLCPVGNEAARKYPRMSKDVYNHIIDQIFPFITFLKLYNYGEPLLHPHIADFVWYAKHKGIETVEITTNGTVLRLNLEYELIRSGLDIYRVSVDGTTQEEYQTYRVGGQLDDVYKNLRRMVAAKKELQSLTPIIEMQLIIMKHNESSLTAFREIAMEIGVDKIRCKTMNAYMSGEKSKATALDFLPENASLSRYSKGDELKVKQEYMMNSCEWPWERLVINGNGEIVPCCYDYNGNHILGSALSGSFQDWWNTKEREMFRNSIRKEPQKIDMCRSCAYGTPDLSVKIENDI